MNKLSIALVTAALAASSPAFAQSGGTAHVEAHLGWDSLPVPDLTHETLARSPASRLLYGGGAGYDVDLGSNIFAGVETNFDLGGSSNCTGRLLTVTDSLCGKMLHDWDIGARVGMNVGPARIYGRVAYDNTRVRSIYRPGDDATRISVSRNFDGLRLGVGAEVPLTGGAYVKAEYRYTTASGLPDQNQLLAGVGIHF